MRKEPIEGRQKPGSGARHTCLRDLKHPAEQTWSRKAIINDKIIRAIQRHYSEPEDRGCLLENQMSSLVDRSSRIKPPLPLSVSLVMIARLTSSKLRATPKDTWSLRWVSSMSKAEATYCGLVLSSSASLELPQSAILFLLFAELSKGPYQSWQGLDSSLTFPSRKSHSLHGRGRQQ
ncbi:hypothetical protein PROFUN_08527 [Planoprotostelium fungivorum]|uniref:Uncharacterized protein n=1 Tax=Planoprotostelium fungivorum TaxID=1890364 RepID=A0A2P6NJC7_9EUKA|nr:hypothetical protein PROFUN_08527 [Planoprotostelium fungivorum]